MDDRELMMTVPRISMLGSRHLTCMVLMYPVSPHRHGTLARHGPHRAPGMATTNTSMLRSYFDENVARAAAARGQGQSKSALLMITERVLLNLTCVMLITRKQFS